MLIQAEAMLGATQRQLRRSAPLKLVRVEGFEPSLSCSQSRRIKPDFPTLGLLYYFLFKLSSASIIQSSVDNMS